MSGHLDNCWIYILPVPSCQRGEYHQTCKETSDGRCCRVMADAAAREQAREEEHFYTDQVGPCSGEDTAALYTWLRELKTVPAALRRRVFDRTARRTLKDLLREHYCRQPGATWVETKDTISVAFTTKRHRVGLREEMGRVHRQLFESLAVFATRFKQLARRAYPEPWELGRIYSGPWSKLCIIQ